MKVKQPLLLLCCCFVLHVFGQDAKRKTRAESFFGLHFDFHANTGDTEIGKTLTRGNIDSLLEAVKPDFIQVDCKGHPGYSSYPTRAGSRLPNYIKDPLQIFREATAAHGVALYVHYSGVLDGRAIELHANWAAHNASGVGDKQETSRQSAYVDSLLIPQLEELAGTYNVDGAWVDGDCWAVRRDYSPPAVAAFTSSTGITKAPVNSSDPNWAAWTKFTRDAFKNYMRKYVDAVHEYKPGFQITSNWAYTAFMPEPVDANIDFISGDVANQSALYDAAFEARCIAPQGKPWDLMSWAFTNNGTVGFSSAKGDVELEQEAAEILAVGGGYNIYYSQARDASITPWIIPQAATLATFCRSRQQYCKGAEPVPQVAVLFSTTAFYKYSGQVFGYSTDGPAGELNGITNGLLDKQYSVQVLMEHTLSGKMDKYPVIVVPGWKELDEGFKKQLLDYVKKGGNLVLTGPGPARFFSRETNINIIDDRALNYVKLGYGGKMNNLFAITCAGQTPADAINIGGVYTTGDLRSRSVPAASIVKYGNGNIAVVYTEIGASYLTHRTGLGMNMLSDIIDKITAGSLVKVQNPFAHINITTNNGKTYVHLINATGPHDNSKVYAYDSIPPLFNIKVRLHTAAKPVTVKLQPTDENLQFTYNNGLLEFTAPEVDVYSIAEISY